MIKRRMKRKLKEEWKKDEIKMKRRKMKKKWNKDEKDMKKN